MDAIDRNDWEDEREDGRCRECGREEYLTEESREELCSECTYLALSPLDRIRRVLQDCDPTDTDQTALAVVLIDAIVGTSTGQDSAFVDDVVERIGLKTEAEAAWARESKA